MKITVHLEQVQVFTASGEIEIDTNDYPDLKNKTFQDIESMSTEELESIEGLMSSAIEDGVFNIDNYCPPYVESTCVSEVEEVTDTK